MVNSDEFVSMMTYRDRPERVCRNHGNGGAMAKILIADDSASMRRQLEKLLSARGHEVIVGEDGVDAVVLFKQERPELVILDVSMPILNGIEALQKIRLMDQDAKVVMVTAEKDSSTVLGAVKLGAGDFIAKPYTEGRLMESVDKMLAA